MADHVNKIHPIVLVISDSKETTAENVIAKIRDLPNSEDAHTIADGHLGYKYEIANKYYTVPVYLCPVASGETSLKNYPLLSKVEGLLIHFDSSDKEFLTQNLPKYLSTAEDLDPECKILMCDKLAEEEQQGITYGAVKKLCTLWDVIELSKEATEEDDDDDSGLNPIGYDELRDALQNIIWSNVEYSGNESLSNPEGMNELIAQLTGAAFGGGGENNEDSAEDPAQPPEELNEELVEEELDMFEKILTQLLTVQSSTSSWSRNERLAYLNDMATTLDNIVEKED